MDETSGSKRNSNKSQASDPGDQGRANSKQQAKPKAGSESGKIPRLPNEPGSKSSSDDQQKKVRRVIRSSKNSAELAQDVQNSAILPVDEEGADKRFISSSAGSSEKKSKQAPASADELSAIDSAASKKVTGKPATSSSNPGA